MKNLLFLSLKTLNCHELLVTGDIRHPAKEIGTEQKISTVLWATQDLRVSLRTGDSYFYPPPRRCHRRRRHILRIWRLARDKFAQRNIFINVFFYPRDEHDVRRAFTMNICKLNTFFFSFYSRALFLFSLNLSSLYFKRFLIFWYISCVCSCNFWLLLCLWWLKTWEFKS